MRNAMLIDPADDVVVAIEPIGKGETVQYVCNGEAVQFPALEDITIHHKVARRDISTGKPVSKYGQHIGVAACDIKKGAHVHVHNLSSHRENLG